MNSVQFRNLMNIVSGTVLTESKKDQSALRQEFELMIKENSKAFPAGISRKFSQGTVLGVYDLQSDFKNNVDGEEVRIDDLGLEFKQQGEFFEKLEMALNEVSDAHSKFFNSVFKDDNAARKAHAKLTEVHFKVDDLTVSIPFTDGTQPTPNPGAVIINGSTIEIGNGSDRNIDKLMGDIWLVCMDKLGAFTMFLGGVNWIGGKITKEKLDQELTDSDIEEFGLVK